MKFFSLIIINIFLFFSSIYCQPDANYYYNLATKSKNSKNYQDAIINYKKAIELYPEYSQEQISLTYSDLQYCYHILNDYTNAIYYCNSWIEKGGWYLGSAYYALGTNYYYYGDFSSAITAYSNAIQNSNSVINGSSLNVINIYSYIKTCYGKLNIKYGWIPESEYWRVNIKNATWTYTKKGKSSCISSFSVRVNSLLPISIKAVNIDLIIKDKKGSIVYKKNHTAWVNDLNTNEVVQSDAFDLANEVCLPTNYVESEKFNWTSVITEVLY